MIRSGRIELATYPNKPLDSMDFNAKGDYFDMIRFVSIQNDRQEKSSILYLLVKTIK